MQQVVNGGIQTAALTQATRKVLPFCINQNNHPQQKFGKEIPSIHIIPRSITECNRGMGWETLSFSPILEGIFLPIAQQIRVDMGGVFVYYVYIDLFNIIL